MIMFLCKAFTLAVVIVKVKSYEAKIDSLLNLRKEKQITKVLVDCLLLFVHHVCKYIDKISV
jgi:hypothetical protein